MTTDSRRSGRRAALAIAVPALVVLGGVAFVLRDSSPDYAGVPRVVQPAAKGQGQEPPAEGAPVSRTRRLAQGELDAEVKALAADILGDTIIASQPLLKQRIEAMLAFLNGQAAPAASRGGRGQAPTLLTHLEAARTAADTAFRRAEGRRDQEGIDFAAGILNSLEQLIERQREVASSR